MSFRPATSAFAIAALLATMLGGCSEYLGRRDTISLHSGEAMAANRVTMMIDPWPAASGRNNLAYNGERAAKASERYRTGKVVRPVSMTTSSSSYQAEQPDSSNNNTPASSGPSGNSPNK